MPRTAAIVVALFVFTLQAGAQDPAGTVTITGPNGAQISAAGLLSPDDVARMAAQSGQQPRDNRPQTGTSRVRGRVTSDTGQPLRRTAVQLIGAPTPHVAITDTDGHYEFDALPSGHFSISAGRAGYVTTRSDGFDLADNQRLDDVNLRVPRGAVIAGQVVDEFGEPVVAATVSPMRQQFMNGRRQLINAGRTTITNDIGEYRLFGLTAGQYYVVVTPQNEQINVFTPGPSGGPVIVPATVAPPGYAPTYYPGTSDAASAHSVTVAPAQTVSNVNFSLTATRLSRVSGTVLDDEGRILTRGAVTLTPRSSMSMGGIGNASGALRPDGSFTISNVPPGTYYARATIPRAVPVAPPAPGVPPAPPLFAVAPVTVVGDDVSGLVLTPVTPAIVRGRIVFDDAGAAALINPRSVRIAAQRIDSMGPPVASVPGNVQANDDFTFELTASPETSIVRANIISSSNQPAAWRTKAFRVNGQDVLDTGVELRPGQTIDDVEIEMTARGQTLTGIVSTPAGAPAQGALVVAYATDSSLWTVPSGQYIGRATADPAGKFSILSLPPGSYFLVAMPQNSPVSDWNDPEILEAAAQSAQRVSISEGGTATLDLKLAR